MGYCQQYRDYTGEPKENTKPGISHHSLDFQALRKQMEPWAGATSQPGTELNVKVKVIDMENGETRIYDFNETKTWDWSIPDLMRVIDGHQITSWDNLAEILSLKVEKGHQEVDIYEAHRFILLGGG
jgi:hypothetical protein